MLVSPKEYKNVFFLDPSSSMIKDELEIYNNKERERFRRKKSSKMRKDSVKLLRKSIETKHLDKQKVFWNMRSITKNFFDVISRTGQY